ncbi:uncharacterized protein TrAFT101_006104 [Trichoderma asperellum]|uniref:uncharacterized protein n=1 Tax=Trichoderma asperellum TaxID=101201 RepID=UPI00333027AC|nr:hypothetical protein TrAFT101_006104 [Trichoderma asperellum]
MPAIGHGLVAQHHSIKWPVPPIPRTNLMDLPMASSGTATNKLRAPVGIILHRVISGGRTWRWMDTTIPSNEKEEATEFRRTSPKTAMTGKLL